VLLISHFKSFERRYAGLSYAVVFSVACRCAPTPLSRWRIQKMVVLGTNKPIDPREDNSQGKYLYLIDVYLFDTYGGQGGAIDKPRFTLWAGSNQR
jgi:hypothetical protein